MTLNFWGGVPIVMSEKSASASATFGSFHHFHGRILTLSVHEVGDGNRVVAGRLHLQAVEDSLGVRLGTDTHVLLAEILDLEIDRDGLLQWQPSVFCRDKASGGCTYKLLGERHLLELERVLAGLGGAEQHSCCQQSTLHDGRRGNDYYRENEEQVSMKGPKQQL
jgi:hypothetical protein